MAKKGLDEDRLKFFKGMGGTQTSESDKPESAKAESETSDSDKSEAEISESDKAASGVSESDMSESDKVESGISESDMSESDIAELATSQSNNPESDKTESGISESDKPESDIGMSGISESEKSRSISKRKQRSSKIPLPKSRAPTTIQKIRARKVDDSVLDHAMLAASKSPKVSIYSPFVAAVLKCNEMTTIGYKSSADSRELLEKALEQAYPDVCEKVRRYMENR